MNKSNSQKRGAAVIAARKLSSAMSAAKAACDHMKSWVQVFIAIGNHKHTSYLSILVHNRQCWL